MKTDANALTTRALNARALRFWREWWTDLDLDARNKVFEWIDSNKPPGDWIGSSCAWAWLMMPSIMNDGKNRIGRGDTSPMIDESEKEIDDPGLSPENENAPDSEIVKLRNMLVAYREATEIEIALRTQTNEKLDRVIDTLIRLRRTAQVCETEKLVIQPQRIIREVNTTLHSFL